jgi:hypothetical protein
VAPAWRGTPDGSFDGLGGRPLPILGNRVRGVFHFSTAQWVILVALSFLWAWIGYRLSENDRRLLGRTPWGLPSALWALFWFLSLVLGLVLYLIAHSVGVRRAQQNPQGMAPSSMAAPPRGQTVAEQFPAYPSPVNSFGPDADMGPDQLAGSPETEATAEEESQSPPAWHPDPSGRFHYRWWDGSEWTSQVSIDGHHLIDTNPDQRIGPY